ncbi:hypothetical protein FQZ97_1103200 [compost metagenome]
MARAETPIEVIAGAEVEVGVAQAQAVGMAELPVDLGLGTAEAHAVGVAREKSVVAQRLADHAVDFVIEQLDVQGDAGFGEQAVIAQLA